jgi:hypothetical protein
MLLVLVWEEYNLSHSPLAPCSQSCGGHLLPSLSRTCWSATPTPQGQSPTVTSSWQAQLHTTQSLHNSMTFASAQSTPYETTPQLSAGNQRALALPSALELTCCASKLSINDSTIMSPSIHTLRALPKKWLVYALELGTFLTANYSRTLTPPSRSRSAGKICQVPPPMLPALTSALHNTLSAPELFLAVPMLRPAIGNAGRHFAPASASVTHISQAYPTQYPSCSSLHSNTA